MRKAIGFLGTTAFVAVAAWACSDVREPSTIMEVEPLQSHTDAACDLGTLEDEARDYTDNPYTGQIIDGLRLIDDGGCGHGDEQLAWEVLNIIEHVANVGEADLPSAGVAIVNALNELVFGNGFDIQPNVLAQGGLFGVRGTPGTLPYPPAGNLDNAPVLSRQAVPMWFRATGADPVVRQVIIGLRPRAGSWAAVAKNGTTVLGLTGFPVDPVTEGSQTAFDAYELDEIPDLGFSAQIDVIACFMGSGIADPHPVGEPGFLPRVRRASGTGGILLQEVDSVDVVNFCNTYAPETQTASRQPSALATLARFAGNILLPERLSAFAVAFSDRESPGMGGGTTWFSKFKLNASDPDGQLAFVEGYVFPAVVTKNQVYEIRVSARDGDGSPMEATTLLTIQNNNGVPGFLVGTFTDCEGNTTGTGTGTPPPTPALGCTVEQQDPAAGGVATYNVSITKTGAFIACIEAFSDGFSFGKVCLPKFNVKN